MSHTLIFPPTLFSVQYMLTAGRTDTAAEYSEGILKGKEPDIMVQCVESLEEFRAIIESGGNKLIVVDFTASWCGPCKFIAPYFESLAINYPTILLYKVDVDEAADIASEYGIRAMPTFQFYKGGKKVAEVCGAHQDDLEAQVKKWSADTAS